VDISSARVGKLIVHRIGNKIRDEGYQLSSQSMPMSSTLEDLLLRSYLSPVLLNGAAYDFHHDSDISLNEVRHFSRLIFSDGSTFTDNSKSIAKHLYSSSTHPNVGGGELIVVLFEDIRTDAGTEQGLGLFRIEAKDDFLDIEEKNGSINLVERVGIALQKIQKGAVILSNNGRIHAIDSLGQKTKYWHETFLRAVPRETPLACAKVVGAFIKAVSSKVASPANALEFGQRIHDKISSNETTTIGEIRKISSSYLEEPEVSGILAGISDRVGLAIGDDLTAEAKQLSRYARDVIRKSHISKGISIVISNQDARVSAVEVQKTKTGLRATIEIQIAEG